MKPSSDVFRPRHPVDPFVDLDIGQPWFIHPGTDPLSPSVVLILGGESPLPLLVYGLYLIAFVCSTVPGRPAAPANLPIPKRLTGSDCNACSTSAACTATTHGSCSAVEGGTH